MAKKKKVKKTSEKVDPNVLEEVFQEITFICPIRGKVTQKVKVKKLKPKGDGQDIAVIPDSDITANLDKDGSLEEEDFNE